MYIFGELSSLTSTTAAMNCANRPPSLPISQRCKGRRKITNEDCDVKYALRNIELSDASGARAAKRDLRVEIKVE